MNKNIPPFVGVSDFTKEMQSLIPNLSKNNASVLLIGERGSGKRLLAQHIHFSAAKNFGYFFEINCKSFSKEQILLSCDTVNKLIAFDQRITLFISNVDELSLELQSSLLELINKTLQKGLDLKLISSAESSLEDKTKQGKFLSDLYYRLNALILNVLPLRQRKEYIIPIAESYLESFRKKSGYKFEQFSEGAKQALINHFWIGNIDELINSVQRAFIVGEEPVINAVDLGFDETFTESIAENSTSMDDKSLKTAVDKFKKEYVTKILEETGWNQTKTAGILGIQRTYVIRLMNELQIRKK